MPRVVWSIANPVLYAGDTGDGIYRIALGGSATDVYCNMSSDGGGWTLLMKQAKGDGVTLQGDTTYWKNGTVLNDNQSNLNVGDGNLVSVAFSVLPTTQFMLQASNESTTKKHTNDSPMTGLAAFSDNRLAVYVDGPNTWYPSRPNWSIHASSYPNGDPLSSARFGFNFIENYLPLAPLNYRCGARWGWAGNQDLSGGSAGSHDACGGLGAWGASYGYYGKNSWQTATYYLWGK